MPETFSPSIRPRTSSPAITVRLKENQFGDGYSQDILDGINAVQAELSLSWPTLTFEQVTEIEAFFRANAGKAFFFALPDEAPKLWRCKEWDAPREKGMASLTATLKEVFA